MSADAIVVIYSICAAVAFLILCAVVCFCVCRRKSSGFFGGGQRVPQLHVMPIPSEGVYPTPLVLQLTALQPNVDILLRIVRQEDGYGGSGISVPPPGGGFAPADGASYPATTLPGEVNVSGFLLYRNELVFEWPGTYYIMTHTMSSDKNISELQQFVFMVTGAVAPVLASGAAVQPPRIVPGSGEVTTSTRVQLVARDSHHQSPQHHGEDGNGTNNNTTTSHRGVTYRYSLDGSFPFTLYTAPFLIPLDTNQNQAEILVSAVAVENAVMSIVAQARLTVFPARSAFFDPTIAAPTVKVLSTGSKLYFESVPNRSDLAVAYVMEFLSDRRHQERSKSDSRPPHQQQHQDSTAAPMTLHEANNAYKKKKTLLYRPGQMIDVATDVARIIAWTIDRRDDTIRSQPAVYDASRQSLSYPSADGTADATKHQQPSPPPPPVMCVACADFSLGFDEVPARGFVLYTLNNAEPDVEDEAHTFRYRPSQPMALGQGEHRQIFVTARIFIRDGGEEDGEADETAMKGGSSLAGRGKRTYRFGHRFFRGFFFS